MVVIGLEEVHNQKEINHAEAVEDQEGDRQEEGDYEEDEREDPSLQAPVQAPLIQWTEHQLAEAGIELAEHMHKLKVYEDSEAKHKRHYRENRDRMIDTIAGLRLRIREQRHALARGETTASDEEE